MHIILPESIWNLIFKYDSTYHNKFKEVLEEFKTSISWKVVWVNSDREPQYGLSEDWAEDICEYWNKTYAQFYGYSLSENPQQCSISLENFPKM